MLQKSTFLNKSIKYILKEATIKGCFLFFFLFLFEPFDAWEYKSQYKLYLLLGLSFIVLTSQTLLHTILRKFFYDQKITLFLYLLIMFLTYNITSYFCALFHVKMAPELLVTSGIVHFYVKGIFVSFVALFYVFYVAKYYLFKQSYEESTRLKKKRKLEKVLLNIKLKNIIVFEADDNYVRIHYKLNSGYSDMLVRATLISIKEIIPDNFFYQCHRSFIINTAFVKEISSNESKTILYLHGYNSEVPLATSKKAQFIQTYWESKHEIEST